jgi:adrenocortical dysplasia protein|uniref:Isoform 5 of Adrenocortical dysplasia protein n=1 Tax=Mus musculus TaxID=10090 RepID=Q5EE38-5|nr:Acd protein [Mus musculus]
MLAPGLTLSQLLDEVREDQDHRGALVCLAKSCLVLKGPCTTTPLTDWITSGSQALVSAGLFLGGFRGRVRQLPC